MSTINDKTKIELYAALAVTPFVIGLIFWLSSINNSANGSQKEILELKENYRSQNQLLISVKEDLTLIKYKLEIKEKK